VFPKRLKKVHHFTENMQNTRDLESNTFSRRSRISARAAASELAWRPWTRILHEGRPMAANQSAPRRPGCACNLGLVAGEIERPAALVLDAFIDTLGSVDVEAVRAA
jgi:hypothetical protein